MKRIFVFTYLIVLFISNGFADLLLEDSERGIRQDAKSRLEAIVQTFDPYARVDVDVKVSRVVAKKETIQSIPFLLTGANEELAKQDKLMISKMGVTVFSKVERESFPQDIIQNLEKLIFSYHKKTNLNFVHIKSPIVNSDWRSEVKALSIFEKSLVFMMFLSFTAFIFFKIVSMKKYQQAGSPGDLGKIIAENMNSLKSAIENVSLFKSSFENDFAKKSAPLSFEINAGGDSFYKDFGLESLEEMLMDCYWAHEDQYAAFLWGKLDILRKGQLITRNHRLSEYAKYISNIDGIDKKYIQESYYFHPLSLAEISNDGLTEIVKQFNSLFHLLPRLRVQHLGLLATDKKKILIKKYSKRDTEVELSHIKWENYKTVEARSFESYHTFQFESLEEEERFFNDGRMDFELVRSFPSLMWLGFLEKNQVEAILAKYSAKELALAWIGPRSILERLKTNLPESKVKMLDSYLSQVVPSKKSAVFLSIVDETASLLKEQRKSA